MSNPKTPTLNAAQQQAVDTTEGPVMVIAGPGTGKTQLLASRVLHILQNNPSLSPANILCLTFTEAGQIAMQKRLIELMGEAGAHVAVHTFHSFGSEIINTHPDYFFNNVQFTPADDLSIHEVITSVLDALPARHPLTAKHEGDYALIGSIKRRIQECKKALTPDELAGVISDGDAFVRYIEPAIIDTFGTNVFTKKQFPQVAELLEVGLAYNNSSKIITGIKPLHVVFNESLAAAYGTAIEEDSTKPLTVWKKDWFAKDVSKKPICKQRVVLEKLAAFAEVYSNYQHELHKRRLFDFDDMIMQAVNSIETRGDLAYELQEQYQYLLVDEFQDTNVVQMRLLRALADAPVHEGLPNVMVVGDDDQAVFAFQGAELSNILNFTETYPSAMQITLTENYRSSHNILQAARAVITQGEDRLENYVKGIDKTLLPNATFATAPRSERWLFDIQAHEYEYVAKHIAAQIKQGTVASDIAVIAREHKQLEALLPYLFDTDVPVAYERRENALNNPQLKELLVLAKVVYYLSIDKPQVANELMPELLSADYWQLPATEIWQISLASRQIKTEYEANKLWLQIMLTGTVKQKNIARFLLEAAKLSINSSLEEILDVLIGSTDAFVADSAESEAVETASSPTIASPFKSYYFSDTNLQNKPQAYLELLAALSAVRSSLRSYKPDITHSLQDYIHFCDLAKKAHVSIPVKMMHATGKDPVNLLSAHKSKGLEFDTVYILSATQSIWNSKGRGGGISLSPNLLSIAHSPNPDDNLRLFYVAMTRAKRHLFMSSFMTSDTGKEMIPYAPLEEKTVQAIIQSPVEPMAMPSTPHDILFRAERHWHDKHLSVPQATLKDLLQDRINRYTLSATHLNNFLDVPNGGPHKFFLHNFLQFPSAMSPSASFGSAMHSTLEYMHSYVVKHGSLPALAKSESFMASSLQRKGLAPNEYDKYHTQAINALNALYAQRSHEFTPKQLPEQDFRRQGVRIGDALLTGKIDVLTVTKHSATVTDYKTGTSSTTWNAQGQTNYAKQKLHRYKQQLYFYKLLVDGSRTWGEQGIRATKGELVFVEPNQQGSLDSLSLDITDEQELTRLRKIIASVWRCIVNLDFPDISVFSEDAKGITEFEDWLIANK
ncbi:ATP-dependent helicase [Candidatus Nomurabacteria bacterium]|nr:ATP-dependent helicase [Candidatus Nomurabacteria bacterium]